MRQLKPQNKLQKPHRHGGFFDGVLGEDNRLKFSTQTFYNRLRIGHEQFDIGIPTTAGRPESISI
jgi:hypothetical protein